MNYLSLLGSHLKSEHVLDLLEPYDIEVIYDFDRFHENTPDQYWTTIEELGLRLKFDEHRILTDLFLFLEPVGVFPSSDTRISGIRYFESKQEVRDFAIERDVVIREGKSEFFGSVEDWIRLDYPTHSIHYDFGDGALKKVTLSLAGKNGN